MVDNGMKPNEKLIKSAENLATDMIGKSLMSPSGAFSRYHNNNTPVMKIGRELRDSRLYDLPILPEAVGTYQDIVCTREWTVSGPPRLAARALDMVHNIRVYDHETGLFEYGLESALARRALDSLTTATTVYVRVIENGKTFIEYLDPTLLTYSRYEGHSSGAKSSLYNPINPWDMVWHYYDGRVFRAMDVYMKKYRPIGSSRKMPALMSVLPSATLAWLIREHDTAAVDGRKIREIIFVNNPQFSEALEAALKISVSLYTGGSVESTGLPVVTMNDNSGKAIKDQIGKLGISEIPQTFDRESFEFSYVNQIAAALGLALRHFWNNEKTTNRALEVVQEQRQQQKGPAAFIKKEQRLINASGFLEPDYEFSSRSIANHRINFSFLEESDTSGQKDRAEVLEKTINAVKNFSDMLGMQVNPQQLVKWLQDEGQLPYEFEILDQTPPVQGMHSDNQMNQDGDETRESDPNLALDQNTGVDKELEYGDVRLSQDGVVLERRVKTYQVTKEINSVTPPQEPSFQIRSESERDEIFDNLLKESYELVASDFKKSLNDVAAEFIPEYIDTLSKEFNQDAERVQSLVNKCLSDSPLTDSEYELVKLLVKSEG